MTIKEQLSTLLTNPKYNNKLTAAKSAELLEGGNYSVTGFVLTDNNGDVCIIDKSAVRWLDKRDLFSMMQEYEQEK